MSAFFHRVINWTSALLSGSNSRRHLTPSPTGHTYAVGVTFLLTISRISSHASPRLLSPSVKISRTACVHSWSMITVSYAQHPPCVCRNHRHSKTRIQRYRGSDQRVAKGLSLSADQPGEATVP